MYVFLKKIIRKSIPKNFLFKNEDFFRQFYGFFFSGKAKECNICDKKLSQFVINERNEFMCPNCGSLSRDRRLWQLLEPKIGKSDCKILDFSPSRCLARKLKKINLKNYISTDFSGEFIADFQYDITHLEIENNTFDVICCYHILEHIEEDKKAMTEIFRVLKPNGKIFVQTPFKEGETYENPLITKPQERLKHFGQDDHVRIYSENNLQKRLENAGFQVEINHFVEQKNNYFGFEEKETVFVISKT